MGIHQDVGVDGNHGTVPSDAGSAATSFIDQIAYLLPTRALQLLHQAVAAKRGIAQFERLDRPFALRLRTVAEAYGGLGSVAAQAGISRESSYRALSTKGNPTVKTILAVLKAVAMRLSVEPEDHALA